MEVVKCSATASDYSGQLVFGSCPVKEESFQTFTPASFGLDGLSDVFKEKGLRIEQSVEMMQCEETEHRREEKSRDGKEKRVTTTYTYNRKWSSTWIDSGRFKNSGDAQDAQSRGCGRDFRSNPSFPFGSETRSVDTLMAGFLEASR